MNIPITFCHYFHVTVRRTTTWFVIGLFRNEENVALERTLETDHTVLEFLVPTEKKEEFLYLIGYLIDKGFAYSVEELENRYAALYEQGVRSLKMHADNH